MEISQLHNKEMNKWIRNKIDKQIDSNIYSEKELRKQFHKLLKEIIEVIVSIGHEFDVIRSVKPDLYKLKLMINAFMAKYLTENVNSFEITQSIENICKNLRESFHLFIYDYNFGKNKNNNIDEFKEELLSYLKIVVVEMNFTNLTNVIKDISVDENRNNCGDVSGDNWEEVMNKSVQAAWSNVTDRNKYFSQNIVKQNLNEIIDLTSGYVWILDMNEQFYYDGTIMLMGGCEGNVMKMKRTILQSVNSLNINYLINNWINVTPLCKGRFGEIVLVKDIITEKEYTVKYLKPVSNSDIIAHCKSILHYFRNRSYVLSARNSPYIVKFCFAFQPTDLSGLFLVFDYCFADLQSFSQLLLSRNRLNIFDELYNMNSCSFLQQYERVSICLSLDLKQILVIYIFELFCILDFLAKCNIIHPEINLCNLLIGQNLHLRLADFGLTFNTLFINKPNKVHSVLIDDYNCIESSKYRKNSCNSELFFDMEIMYHNLTQKNPQIHDELKKNITLIRDISCDSYELNFLSNIWAMGVIALSMLSFGTMFMSPHYASKQFLDDCNLTKDTDLDYFILLLTLDSYNNTRFFRKGFNAVCGSDFYQLTDFLTSIIQPRISRCTQFLTKKEILKNEAIKTVEVIDINKVENIDVFKLYRLNSQNAFMYQLPATLNDYIRVNSSAKYQNFGDFIHEIKAKQQLADLSELLPVNLGCDIINGNNLI